MPIVPNVPIVPSWGEPQRATLVFAGTAALLVWFVAPDAVWLDAGELTASLFSAGVSHPTGFPLYHPPGKLATFLPMGGVAFRANLLSALLGAATLAAQVCPMNWRKLVARTRAMLCSPMTSL